MCESIMRFIVTVFLTPWVIGIGVCLAVAGLKAMSALIVGKP